VFEEPRVRVFELFELGFDLFGDAIVDHLVWRGWGRGGGVGGGGDGGGGRSGGGGGGEGSVGAA